MSRSEPFKPRTVHLVHFDGPGGGPQSIRNFASHLQNEYEHEFIMDGHGLITDYAKQAGLKAFHIPLRKLWKIPFGFLPLVRLLRQRRPDVLILHGQWAGPIGALAGKCARVKSMIYIARFPAFYTDWDLRRIIRNHFAELIPCRLADKTVVLSQGNAYQYLIRGLVADDKAVLINNCVSPDSYVDEPTRHHIREQFGWDPSDCHVCSVGRIADQKRLDWLLRAWKTVCAAEPRARLWIVGGGDATEVAALKQLTADLALTGCTFLGPQPHGVRFLAAADIVAMTTLYEGHANIPLEAMLNGKPIVANGVDGVTDSLTNGVEGFLVQPGDIQQFADRLLELIRTPTLREEMGNRGMERAKAFSPKVIYTRYRELLQRLAR